MSWPAKGAFTISRSSLTLIPTVWVEIEQDGHKGRAECRPYARYGDTVQTVMTAIEQIRPEIESGLTTVELQKLIPPGPARNAVDCALWDLKAKISGTSVRDLLGLPAPKPRLTAFTLSLQSPLKMAEAALAAKTYPVLKVKVDGPTAVNCVRAVLNARPEASLIIDANEGLDRKQVDTLCEHVPKNSILMFEQPVSSNLTLSRPFETDPIICADESLHSSQDITKADLEKLRAQGYRALNIKLDKCGGLTAALNLMRLAKEMEFQIMAGCMVGSSLAMAPMLILESFADILDLDGPLLLAEDCENGLRYEGPKVYPPASKLWG